MFKKRLVQAALVAFMLVGLFNRQAARAVSIVEFPVPGSNTAPQVIVTGSDGNHPYRRQPALRHGG
jgi:hypothetical protein